MRSSLILLILGDAIVAAHTLLLGYALHFEGLSGIDEVLDGGAIRVVAFVVMVLFSGFFCELYSGDRRQERLELAARIAVTQMFAFLTLSAIYYMIPQVMIGRGFLTLSLLLCGLCQYLLHRGHQMLTSLPGFAQRVLILGVGPLAQTIEGTIPRFRTNYVFAGYVRPEGDPMTVPPEQVLGEIDQIQEVIEKARAHKVVVSITERRGVLPVRELLSCKLAGGVDVVDSLTFYEQMTGKLLIENIQPSWFIYSNGFRVTAFMRFYKRMFDLLFSGLGIVLALPALPVIALLVKFDSPGPVLFRQKRVGERNREFFVYKFRTMCQDAEKQTGAVWAQANDPRITRVGGILRKTRLDEIPQLFNVLKGDMSFVGPRPERPEFVEKLNEKIPYYAKRHFMKPGVTGWAQVCYPYGASEEDALEKLRYDLFYIKNYSLMLDFLIIFETIKVVLYGRGGR